MLILIHKHIPVCIYLLVEQLKQSRRVELIVLDNRLLGWAWRLGSLGLGHS